jgi:hypothetical protein
LTSMVRRSTISFELEERILQDHGEMKKFRHTNMLRHQVIEAAKIESSNIILLSDTLHYTQQLSIASGLL